MPARMYLCVYTCTCACACVRVILYFLTTLSIYFHVSSSAPTYFVQEIHDQGGAKLLSILYKRAKLSEQQQQQRGFIATTSSA